MTGNCTSASIVGAIDAATASTPAEGIRASVVITVLNEESTISCLIESILGQSLPPNEIIIVDGGSKDRTVEIIEEYRQDGAPIRLIVVKGCNIARGRNVAIEYATNEVIACINAGTVADVRWLERILAPFERDESVDAVAGFFLPSPRLDFEEVVGDLLYPKLDRIRADRFLPPALSIAFRKRSFDDVKGYPEWLNTAEDSLFDIGLIRAGCKIAFASDAVVYWRPRSNLWDLFRQYYLYAKGTREAGITRMGTIEVYGRNVAAYAIPLFVKSFLSFIRKGEGMKACYVPLILCTVLLAKIAGLAMGRRIEHTMTDKG